MSVEDQVLDALIDEVDKDPTKTIGDAIDAIDAKEFTGIMKMGEYGNHTGAVVLLATNGPFVFSAAWDGLIKVPPPHAHIALQKGRATTTKRAWLSSRSTHGCRLIATARKQPRAHAHTCGRSQTVGTPQNTGTHAAFGL